MSNITKLNQAINKAVIDYLIAENAELSNEIAQLLLENTKWDYHSYLSDSLSTMIAQAIRGSNAIKQ